MTAIEILEEIIERECDCSCGERLPCKECPLKNPKYPFESCYLKPITKWKLAEKELERLKKIEWLEKLK